MTPRKPWYSHLTLDHLIKYFTLAMFITGMITAIGRAVAVPYMQKEINGAIQINNKWLEGQYAGKNELLIKTYELQKENNENSIKIIERLSKIEGKLNK
jgi:hypothetical protein